jgi:hypothetical protein
MLFKPATLGRQLSLVLSGIAKAGALVCSSVEHTAFDDRQGTAWNNLDENHN